MTEPRYTEAQIRAAFATRGEWWTDRHWPDFLAALAAGEPPAEVCVDCGNTTSRKHYCDRQAAGGSGVGAPTPLHSFRSLNGGPVCVALVGPVENPRACLGAPDHPVHGGAPTPPAPLKPEYLASIRADIKRNQYAEPEDTERLIAEVERLYGQREMERGDDHA